MDKWQRRTVYYFVVMTGLMFAYALVYQWGMVNLEGAEGVRTTFVHAFQVVVETFTTTGFGSDAPWETTFMNVLVIVMDTTGTLMIFLALPVILFPALEDAFETTVPTTADESLSDHVVISTHSPRVDALISELDAAGIEYVIVEPDRETALDLYEDGYRAIHEDLRSTPPDSGVPASRRHGALVTDVSDRIDVRVVLTARELDEDVQIVSVVEDPDRATYHELAGADVVISPRQVIGERLAEKVLTRVSMDLAEDIDVGEDFDLVEIPIGRESTLAGTTIAESDIRERFGVSIVGVWSEEKFRSPTPETAIDAGTVLLVAERQTQIDELQRWTQTGVRTFTRKDTVVVGYGEVGRTVVSRLEEESIETTVIDIKDRPGVDIVGDATDAEVLREAGVGSAEYVTIVLPDDATAEFSALVARDLNRSAELVARVQETESVEPMYRAGADYVLSLGTITGRMIASAVADTDGTIVVDIDVEAIQTLAPGLVGQTLGEARVRSETGCTVIAVVRDGRVLTDLGPDSSVREHDELVVVGPAERVDRFRGRFGTG